MGGSRCRRATPSQKNMKPSPTTTLHPVHAHGAEQSNRRRTIKPPKHVDVHHGFFAVDVGWPGALAGALVAANNLKPPRASSLLFQLGRDEMLWRRESNWRRHVHCHEIRFRHSHPAHPGLCFALVSARSTKANDCKCLLSTVMFPRFP